MHVGHEAADGLAHFWCDELHVWEEAVADRDQGLVGPLVEPVDAGAVHYGRKLAGTHSQSWANRRETKYNLKVGRMDHSYMYIHMMRLQHSDLQHSYSRQFSLTLSCRLTLSMKKDQQFSRVSCSPAPFTSFLTPLITFSSSSSTNSSGISPEASRSLMRTKNLSSGTCASVRRKTVPTFFRPAFT